MTSFTPVPKPKLKTYSEHHLSHSEPRCSNVIVMTRFGAYRLFSLFVLAGSLCLCIDSNHGARVLCTVISLLHYRRPSEKAWRTSGHISVGTLKHGVVLADPRRDQRDPLPLEIAGASQTVTGRPSSWVRPGCVSDSPGCVPLPGASRVHPGDCLEYTPKVTGWSGHSGAVRCPGCDFLLPAGCRCRER